MSKVKTKIKNDVIKLLSSSQHNQINLIDDDDDNDDNEFITDDAFNQKYSRFIEPDIYPYSGYQHNHNSDNSDDDFSSYDFYDVDAYEETYEEANNRIQHVPIYVNGSTQQHTNTQLALP